MLLTRFFGQSRIRQLVYLRDLLRELVVRDMKARYKGKVLGVAWSLMQPLLLLAVFHFIFRLVLEVDIPRFSTFAFSGMLAWTWFQASILESTGAITDNRELIKWPGFPVAILPFVSVTSNLVHFLLALPVLILFLLITGTGLHLTILALPLIAIPQFVFTLSLGYVVAAVHVIFRDTRDILMVLLQLGFFLSPIFYEASMVPAEYIPYYQLNPFVHLIGAYRAILIAGTLPDGRTLLVIGAVGTMLLLVGLRVFSGVRYRFVERL